VAWPVDNTQRAGFGHIAQKIWDQGARPSPKRPGGTIWRRHKGTDRDVEATNSTVERQKPEVPKPPSETNPSQPAPEHESLADSVSKLLHLPKIPHRPTKEELLAAATGFWQRLRVRFKWFSIRSMRPWNADEWGAFVSWLIFGHLVWILIGTTTFFSLIILFINTVFAQETLAQWVGDYLTQSAGITVIFESAIVPKWKDGVITFKNVFVSRRPGQGESSVHKGSSNAAAEAAAARQTDQDNAVTTVEEDDGNYTQFDVTMNTVNVTLSFVKWWNGKGLLKDVEVKGVRGVVDRTSVNWTAEGLDPLDYRHEHTPGDFELDHFKMEDLLVTVHQPNGFRPFQVSIFSCELPQLRKQWLFYDFMSASHMSGAYDGSLFTIHPRQIHDVAAADDDGRDELGKPSVWKKFSRLRIDGLKIDHLNRGVEGPFGWIYEGNVDMVADVMFPSDPEEGLGKVVAEFYEKMEDAVTSNRYLRILDNNGSSDKAQTTIENRSSNQFDGEGKPLPFQSASSLPGPYPSSPQESSPEQRFTASGDETQEADPVLNEEQPRGYLVMDLRIHLNDVRAAVPFFPKTHIGYVNLALVRPIVAYINAKRTYIPISCRIVKRHTDFDGSWTVWDCGLMDDLGAEVYTAFARDVEDQQSRVRRFKRVGLWTVSLIVHALLAGVAGDLV
jgi:distribution and morphology protein 31